MLHVSIVSYSIPFNGRNVGPGLNYLIKQAKLWGDLHGSSVCRRGPSVLHLFQMTISSTFELLSTNVVQ
ncbi:hypothetical protein EPI10_024574 [Gossypium australe]|uniref:Uncharacterized protein n=1 Tax=Gossypium australe TaxID=47621 RepID=A0A5B6VYW5_9ROSI|nr:hypothetical protein EPI10_024574 [Gossypium australe]